MSVDRWMDKEVVVHIHNWILLSYKKEHIWVSSNEVDEHRAYYTEWSKSERERQILHINTYIWNLERQYWWSHLQGSKGDSGIKNGLLDTVGEGEGGMTWENSIEIYTLLYVKQIDFSSFSKMPLNYIQVVVSINNLFLFMLSSIQQFECTTICLIHLLRA